MLQSTTHYYYSDHKRQEESAFCLNWKHWTFHEWFQFPIQFKPVHLNHPAVMKEVFISWWRHAKAYGTGKHYFMQCMLWHTVILNMSEQLKKGRETALNWQMSLVHCLPRQGFVFRMWAQGSKSRYWTSVSAYSTAQREANTQWKNHGETRQNNYRLLLDILLCPLFPPDFVFQIMEHIRFT